MSTEGIMGISQFLPTQRPIEKSEGTEHRFLSVKYLAVDSYYVSSVSYLQGLKKV